MTAQFGETLVYRGETMEMYSEPLEQYFQQQGYRPDLKMTCTACWRGYIGTWEIQNERLYLTALAKPLSEDDEACLLKTIFPDSEGKVFASWFTGTLRVPQGEQLEYVHMGYATVFERDLILEIAQGVLVGQKVSDNVGKEIKTAETGRRSVSC